jgi:hypothetical protein
LRESLIQSLTESERNKIIAEQRQKASENIPDKMVSSEKYVRETFDRQVTDATLAAQTTATWSENGKITDKAKIIENGYQAKLAEDTKLPKLYEKYSNLANEVYVRETALKNVGKDVIKELQKQESGTPNGLSQAYLNAYSNLQTNDDVSKLLSTKEAEFLKKKGADVGNLYEIIPANIKASIDARLSAAGLKPDFDTLPNGSLLKSQYERVIVSQYLETKVIDQKKAEMSSTIKEVKKVQTEYKTEVTNTVDSTASKIQANLVVKIPQLDANGDPVLKNGKPVMESVRLDNPDLTAKQRELVDKANKEKLQTAINKEQAKDLKVLLANGEQFAENLILERAIAIERESLLKVSPEKISEIASREADPAKRAIELQKAQEELKLLNKDRLQQLDDLDFNSRVNKVVDYTKLNQIGDLSSGAAREILNTYDKLKSLDIEKTIADVPEKLRDEVRKNLETIRDGFKNEADFALKTSSALCNVISGWEAARLANRPGISENFADFYVDQVKRGEITVGTHNGAEAPFYGSGKNYLDPSHLVKDIKDTNAVMQELNSTANNVVVVEIDTDKNPDGKGNHFIVATRQNGEWMLRDHTSKEAWRMNGSLSKALEDGKITAIRILDPIKE